MARQGSYPMGQRTLSPTDTLTGVVEGATADVPLSTLGDFFLGTTVVQSFKAVDGDFTPGVTNTLYLEIEPGSKTNVMVFFDAAYQTEDQIASLFRTQLVFTSPIPDGVQEVEVRMGSVLPMGTPGDDSVGDAQLTWGNVLMRICSTAAEMLALDTTRYTRAYIMGNGVLGDGYSAPYYFNPSDTTSPDNGWSIRVGTGGARWYREDAPVRTGCVRMVQTGISSWMLYGPQGEPISTVGTTTQGLQEAINYATGNGYSLQVIGGMTSRDPGGVDYGLLFCTSPISFPSMRSTRIDVHGAHVIFEAAVTGPGLNFDSCMEVFFDARGSEWVYQGNASAVHFAPVNPVPVDPQVSIVDSEFQFGSVVANGGSPPYCVHFDCTQGPVTDSKFTFAEINGNGAVGQPSVAQYGVAVQVPATASGFTNNIVEARHIHHPVVGGVQVGLNSIGASSLNGNQWRITSISTANAAATGFNTFGSNDIVDIGVINSAVSVFTTGLFVEPGANNNFFRIGQIAGNTGLAVNNQGSGNKVWANGQFQDPKAQVNLAGSNQNIGSGVWTKVAFASEEFDIGQKFNPLQNRWTPATVGYAEISAITAWDTMVAGNALWVAIYKNGVNVKQARLVPSATSGGQGPFVTAIVNVSAITDYFEIFVFQGSGSTQTLDGAAGDTWATFKML